MDHFITTCWMLIFTGAMSLASLLYQPEDIPDSTPALRITKVKLKANPMTYTGPCPVEIKFTAKVSATGSGPVVCRILRSDNMPAPEITFNFTHSGTIDTTYIYNATDNFMGWQQLEVIKPNKIMSNKVEFTVMCVN